jgi:hypothetical protein
VSVHFAAEELAAHRKAAAGELATRVLDGLLMFRQESRHQDVQSARSTMPTAAYWMRLGWKSIARGAGSP